MTKSSVAVIAVLIAFPIFVLTLLISQWFWLTAPLWFWVYILALKRAPKDSAPPSDERIQTQIFTVGEEMKNCTIVIGDSALTILPQRITVPLADISDVMFEDKSTPDMSMAGFGIDYTDSQGPAQLMFFNSGLFPVSKARKAVASIKAAHSKFFEASGADPLKVIDVIALKKARSASFVHRNF